jgi:hypothetical protein
MIDMMNAHRAQEPSEFYLRLQDRAGNLDEVRSHDEMVVMVSSVGRPDDLTAIETILNRSGKIFRIICRTPEIDEDGIRTYYLEFDGKRFHGFIVEMEF